METTASTRALLELVESDRADRCEAIGQQVAEASRAVLAEARSAARARVSDAMAAQRRRLRERLSAFDATLATESRLHDQRRFRALLDEAWRRLPVALEARWREPAARREWTRHVLACAREQLAPGGWTLAYAPGWPEDERRAVIEALATSGYAVAAATEDARMRAGLQVRSGGNVLDGTLHGLLADHNAIGARLLDEFARTAA